MTARAKQAAVASPVDDWSWEALRGQLLSAAGQITEHADDARMRLADVLSHVAWLVDHAHVADDDSAPVYVALGRLALDLRCIAETAADVPGDLPADGAFEMSATFAASADRVAALRDEVSP